jgi:ankyrin repeat protein
LLRRLIDRYDYNTSETDHHGRNIAHFAAWGGQHHILDYLLSKGVNGMALDVTGRGLLHYAASSTSLHSVQKTIQFHEAVPAPYNTWSPLHWASRVGISDILRALFDHGLTESVVTTTEPEYHWTPRIIAGFHQHSDLFKDLEHGHLDSSVAYNSNPSIPWVSIKHGTFFCDGCRLVSRSFRKRIQILTYY